MERLALQAVDATGVNAPRWLAHAGDAPAQLAAGESVLLAVRTAGLSPALARQRLRSQLDDLPCLAAGWREGGHGPEPHDPALRLSLSYGNGVAVLAVRAGAVGVDITPWTPPADWPAVAAVYLGEAACARLAGQGVAFAVAWAALEASHKCLGVGLAEYAPAMAARCAALRVWHDDAHLPGHCLALAWP